MTNLWDEQGKYFFRLVGESLTKDTTLDASSFYGPVRFGVVAPDDPRIKESFEIFKSRLSKGIEIGGVARYENDAYLKVPNNAIGNPWFITMLWFTQYKIAIATSVNDLNEVINDLERVAKMAKSGMLSEQLNPMTGEFLSATPLTWSHAEFVRTVLEYDKKLNSFNVSKN